MNIRRATRPNQYTNIDNDVINDPRLSAAALGVLIYLLSKFDNWTANKKHLLKRFKTGYNKLSVNGLDNCFKELRNAGYAELVPVMKKNSKGKMYFSGSEYVIYDKSKIEYSPSPEDLPEPENIPSPEDSPRPEILEPPKSLGVIITTTDNTITNNKDIKANKQNLSAPVADKMFNDFKSVLSYLTEKSGNRFRLGKIEKVKKSDKYKKITARLKEYSMEDIKAVIDVKCAEWGDSAKWCKYLVPKTLFSKTNFEKYLDDVENVDNNPTPKTKNLVESYRGHLSKYLNEKQLKLMNGKIQALLSKAGENAVQAKIKGLKWEYGDIKNKTFTEALIFDVCYGTLSACGTKPERRISKFFQWFNGLSDYKKNQWDLRKEFKTHISK